MLFHMILLPFHAALTAHHACTPSSLLCSYLCVGHHTAVHQQGSVLLTLPCTSLCPVSSVLGLMLNGRTTGIPLSLVIDL